MNKRAKACDISGKVKKAVYERDRGRCVVCGGTQYIMPNAHYISRAKGGMGIEENIVTLCTDFGNRCHSKYDNGSGKEQKEIRAIIKAYLQEKYPDWDESKLLYRKWGN